MSRANSSINVDQQNEPEESDSPIQFENGVVEAEEWGRRLRGISVHLDSNSDGEGQENESDSSNEGILEVEQQFVQEISDMEEILSPPQWSSRAELNQGNIAFRNYINIPSPIPFQRPHPLFLEELQIHHIYRHSGMMPWPPNHNFIDIFSDLSSDSYNESLNSISQIQDIPPQNTLKNNQETIQFCQQLLEACSQKINQHSNSHVDQQNWTFLKENIDLYQDKLKVKEMEGQEKQAQKNKLAGRSEHILHTVLKLKKKKPKATSTRKSKEQKIQIMRKARQTSYGQAAQRSGVSINTIKKWLKILDPRTGARMG